MMRLIRKGQPTVFQHYCANDEYGKNKQSRAYDAGYDAGFEQGTEAEHSDREPE